MRGGTFGSDSFGLLASDRFSRAPADEVSVIGFRVAIIPEPSTAVLTAMGLVCLAIAGWRRKR